MIDRNSKRDMAGCIVGMLLVVSLIIGVAVNDRRTQKESGNQLAAFNEQLAEDNLKFHRATVGNAAQIHSSRLQLNSSQFDHSRSFEAGAKDTKTKSEDDQSDANATSKPDFIKPFVGEKQQVRQPPEFDWLNSSRSIDEIIEFADERNLSRDIYAWIQIRSDTKPSELNALISPWGARIYGTSSGHARVKLPANRETLERIAALPSVEGFGLKPPSEKHGPQLIREFEDAGVGSQLPVFITVMAANAEKSMRRELIELGATVGIFDKDLQAFFANVDKATLDSVLAADFVAEVSPNVLMQALLNDLTAVVGADVGRSYSSSTQSFTGNTGAGIKVGVLDTGINTFHKDFSDKTVCTKSFVSYEHEAEASVDTGLHGTHVSGIAVGGGKVNAAWAGVAPGVADVRMGKVLDVEGFGDAYNFINGVNFMSTSNPCGYDTDSGPPKIVNISLGNFQPQTDGTALVSRKMDAASFQNRQNYVVAASNLGPAGITEVPSSKNVLSVGATTDGGVITTFSSHGPTSDGRLSPHVVAPGNSVISTLGRGSLDRFYQISGTSMATPAVAGMAAVFLESHDDFNGHPAAVRSSLMAGAIKPRRWVGSMQNMPSDNTDGPGDMQVEYGLGLASLVPFDLEGVTHDSLKADLESDETASTSITIPEDTSRLDIVLTWYEPATLTLGPTVVSNLDLYLDKDNDCTEDACGEYSSKSTIDNVEWILIKDPEPGTYQLKVVPENSFDHTVQFGVSWVTIADDEPELTVTSDSSSISVDSGDYLDIELDIGASSYVATGTTLHILCRSNESIDDVDCPEYDGNFGSWLPGSSLERPDGTKSNLDFAKFENPLHLGSITVGTGRTVKLRVPALVVQRTGSHTLYFVATSWNGKSGYKAIDVVVDESESLPSHASEPANDEVANATALSGESGTMLADLTLATREPGEPMLRLDRSSNGKLFSNQSAQTDSPDYVGARHNSVWYKIAGLDTTNQLSFSRIPSYVSIMVYRDEPNESSRVGHNSTPDNSLPVLTVNLASDTTYYIQLYAHIDVGRVSVPWVLGPPTPPSNDHFADAQVISGDSGSFSGTNFNASLEPFEYYGDRVGYSTWFTWSPEESGLYRFNANIRDFVIVFDDAEKDQLRRLSTTPEEAFFLGRVYVYADSEETYRIAVLSIGGPILLLGYELEWEAVTTARDHAFNDRFSSATVVASKATSIDEDTDIGRTVDPGEPRTSGTGTRWWRWTPTVAGDYTFRFDEFDRYIASIFSGTSLEELELVAQGTEFVATLEAATEYYISIGVSYEDAFIDFHYNPLSSTELSWGATPVNNLRSSPMSISGNSGSSTYSHRYATHSPADGLPFGMSRSLWWEWTAPETGWFQFKTSKTAGRIFNRRLVDSVIAIFDEASGNRIATSDRTLFLSGEPQTTIYATSGSKYLIQTSLREYTSTNENNEISIDWEKVDPPPFSRYVGQLREVDADPELEIRSLVSPKAIAANDSGDRLFVNAADALLVLDVAADESLPGLTKEVEYEDQAGTSIRSLARARLFWESTSDLLYAMASDGIYLLQDVDNENPYFSSCLSLAIGFDDVLDVTTNDTATLFFVLAEIVGGSRVAAFSRTGNCAFAQETTIDHTRASALRDAYILATIGEAAHIYVATDRGMLILNRDETTGALSYGGLKADHQVGGSSVNWDEGSLLLAADNEHIFALGASVPAVGVYSLDTPNNPELVDTLTDFYVTEDFDGPTFESYFLPDVNSDCRVVSSHTSTTAIDFMCPGALFTVELNEADQLFLRDGLLTFNRDRFNKPLSGVSFHTVNLTVPGVRPQSASLYLLTRGLVDRLMVFDHASQIDSSPYVP